MKKLTTLVLATLISQEMLASGYGEYGYSDNSMPTIAILTFIVLLVWGVLEIILFFKIWKMTNNVQRIVDSTCPDVSFLSEEQLIKRARDYVLAGNTAAAKQLYIDTFAYHVNKSRGRIWAKLSKKGIENTWEQVDKLSIEPYVNSLKKKLERIGEPLPEYIANLKTFGDFKSIIRKEDFELENLDDQIYKEEDVLQSENQTKEADEYQSIHPGLQ